MGKCLLLFAHPLAALTPPHSYQTLSSMLLHYLMPCVQSYFFPNMGFYTQHIVSARVRECARARAGRSVRVRVIECVYACACVCACACVRMRVCVCVCMC